MVSDSIIDRTITHSVNAGRECVCEVDRFGALGYGVISMHHYVQNTKRLAKVKNSFTLEKRQVLRPSKARK